MNRYIKKRNIESKVVSPPQLYVHEQTKLKHRVHISTKSPKEVFNNTVFQSFMDELKH